MSERPENPPQYRGMDAMTAWKKWASDVGVNEIVCVKKHIGRGCDLIDEDSGECPHETDKCPRLAGL